MLSFKGLRECNICGKLGTSECRECFEATHLLSSTVFCDACSNQVPQLFNDHRLSRFFERVQSSTVSQPREKVSSQTITGRKCRRVLPPVRRGSGERMGRQDEREVGTLCSHMLERVSQHQLCENRPYFHSSVDVFQHF